MYSQPCAKCGKPTPSIPELAGRIHTCGECMAAWYHWCKSGYRPKADKVRAAKPQSRQEELL